MIWPALEHCLKCSHLFNILDSSNSIGVTERTAYILRIRQLAIGDRESLRRRRFAGRGRRGEARRRRRRRRVMDRELLLEIGCEELPASWLPGLTNQIGEVVAAQLREHRLPPEAPVETFSTPRRLTVRIARIAERQTDLEELVNGPPVSASFQPDGTPTPRRRGLRREAGRRGQRARARRDAEGRIPGLPQAAARQGGGGRAARRAGRHAARCRRFRS